MNVGVRAKGSNWEEDQNGNRLRLADFPRLPSIPGSPNIAGFSRLGEVFKRTSPEPSFPSPASRVQFPEFRFSSSGFASACPGLRRAKLPYNRRDEFPAKNHDCLLPSR